MFFSHFFSSSNVEIGPGGIYEPSPPPENLLVRKNQFPSTIVSHAASFYESWENRIFFGLSLYQFFFVVPQKVYKCLLDYILLSRLLFFSSENNGF